MWQGEGRAKIVNLEPRSSTFTRFISFNWLIPTEYPPRLLVPRWHGFITRLDRGAPSLVLKASLRKQWLMLWRREDFFYLFFRLDPCRKTCTSCCAAPFSRSHFPLVISWKNALATPRNTVNSCAVIGRSFFFPLVFLFKPCIRVSPVSCWNHENAGALKRLALK